MPSPRRVYVSAWELRGIFNAENFPEKIRRGETVPVRVKSWPADPARNLPPETFTLMLEYYAYPRGKKTFVALVHQYQQRGVGNKFETIHDPKQLIVNDVHYVLAPE